MYWIGPILALVGVALLVYGFAKNNRKLLAVAGITLFLAGSATDFLEGFFEGLERQDTTTARVGSPSAGA